MHEQDICENNHGGNPESVEAFDRALMGASAARSQILRFLGLLPASCDEYEAATGVKHQTASARFSELKRDGQIVVVGRRPTRSGTKAAVYALAKSRASEPPLFRA